MNTDIQAKIKEYAKVHAFEQSDFINGANFILSHPELLREQMEAMLEWIAEGMGTDVFVSAKLFDLYIEQLNKKA